MVRIKNVGELKKFLKNIPDNVTTETRNRGK